MNGCSFSHGAFDFTVLSDGYITIPDDIFLASATSKERVEMLGGTLLTIHNLHFFLDLMSQARAHIEAGDFGTWHLSWIARYEAKG